MQLRRPGFPVSTGLLPRNCTISLRQPFPFLVDRIFGCLKFRFDPLLFQLIMRGGLF